MYQGMTVRLYPTKAQEKQFRNRIGGCRFMWNYMLQLQMERRERNEKYFKKFDMFKHITEMKKKPEYKWLSEIAVHSLQRICADLDWAYQKVFRHTSGRPKFKSKKKAKQSYPVPAEHMYFRYGYAQISMVGKVRFVIKLIILGLMLNLSRFIILESCMLTKSGFWFLQLMLVTNHYNARKVELVSILVCESLLLVHIVSQINRLYSVIYY